MPTFWNASPKPFTKTVITKGYGYHTPQDGSVCKIKIIVDESSIIADLDDSQEKEIIVGDVDEPIDRIIEDCIRTMKEEEVCRLQFVQPCHQPDTILNPLETSSSVEEKVSEASLSSGETKDDPLSANENTEDSDTNECVEVNASDEGEVLSATENSEDSSAVKAESPADGKPDNEDRTVDGSEKNEQTAVEDSTNLTEVEFQLVSYTREPEIWEMSVTEKWRRASYHKQKGLDLYSRGAYQYAFHRFGLTLKYVISLEHDIPSGQEEGMDIKGLKLSCYLNVAACQMRHYNFESVVINASKALAIHPINAKALYRRGAAYLQLQEFEKAKEDLTKAQQLEPKNQAVAKQLQLLKCQVQKLNQYYATAMKKLFT